jgi:hypothetical protein
MLSFYEQFMARARNAATPSLNRYAYPQAQDPFKTGRLGSGSPQAMAGGGGA